MTGDVPSAGARASHRPDEASSKSAAAAAAAGAAAAVAAATGTGATAGTSRSSSSSSGGGTASMRAPSRQGGKAPPAPKWSDKQQLMEKLMSPGPSEPLSQANRMDAPPAPSGGLAAAAPRGPASKKDVEALKAAVSELQRMLVSESPEEKLKATKKFRKLLTADRDTLVQEVLDRDIVPQLLMFLRQSGHAALQVEALWALTNIAAGTTEHTQMLLKNDAVPTLVSLLGSTHQEVLEQAVWVLGNIAGDSTGARDKVLAGGTLMPLLKCMQDTRKTSLLRIATWTLSNLCDGQPRPDINVHAVLATLRTVLLSEDTEVLSHACWALSHLCDGPSPHIEAVVQADVCGRLVQLLHSKSWRVVKPALRTVGNIVCAEDEQDYTQQIIDCGAVPCLRQLISHSNREIQKEACWTLSNIAAGTVDQIQQVLDSGSIPTLVKLASKDAETDPDVKIEACWVLLNATSCGSDSQIEHLVHEGCVAVLCNLLQDNSMVLMALEGLEKILQVGEDAISASRAPGAGAVGAPAAAGAAATDAVPHNGAKDGDEKTKLTTNSSILLTADKIQELQKHRNSQIAKRATRMWKDYFVVCAICKTPYSRQSPATKFCQECKCSVCVNCDCSRFHLSYQDQLWKELAEGEAEEERSKQASKKSKRQKKRAKEKKRKELLKAQEEQAAQQAAQAKAEAQAEAKRRAEAKRQADAKANAKVNADKNPKDRPKNSKAPKEEGATPPPDAGLSEKAHNAKASGVNIINRDDAPSSKLPDLDDLPDPNDDDMGLTAHNDAYVDFLNNKGSILDLWKIMASEDQQQQDDLQIHEDQQQQQQQQQQRDTLRSDA